MAEQFQDISKKQLIEGDGILTLNNMLREIFRRLPGEGDVRDYFGYGSPLNVVSAPVGSRYMRLDGGANTSMYVKESGTDGSGWVAK